MLHKWEHTKSQFLCTNTDDVLQTQLPYCETASHQRQNHKSIRPVNPDNILTTQVMYICFIKAKIDNFIQNNPPHWSQRNLKPTMNIQEYPKQQLKFANNHSDLKKKTDFSLFSFRCLVEASSSLKHSKTQPSGIRITYLHGSVAN